MLLLTTNGIYSQERLLSEVQRDSAYAKIQRGNINAERVKDLTGALQACDSVKALAYNIIGLNKKEKEALHIIIDKKNTIISAKDDIIEAEVKRGRRRGFWNFVKGGVVGAALTVAVLVI